MLRAEAAQTPASFTTGSRMGLGLLACGCVRHSGNLCQTKSLLYNRKVWITRHRQVVRLSPPCSLNYSFPAPQPTPGISALSVWVVPGSSQKEQAQNSTPTSLPPSYSQSPTMQFGVLKASQEQSNYIQNCKKHLPPEILWPNCIIIHLFELCHPGLSSHIQEAKEEMCEKDHAANKNTTFPQNLSCNRLPQRIGHISKTEWQAVLRLYVLFKNRVPGLGDWKPVHTQRFKPCVLGPTSFQSLWLFLFRTRAV